MSHAEHKGHPEVHQEHHAAHPGHPAAHKEHHGAPRAEHKEHTAIEGPKYEAVYEDHGGIAGIKPSDTSYRAFAFDGNSSGRLDHICWYRCGGGLFTVLRRAGRGYHAVYTDWKGIGDFNFSNAFDHAFAFDFDGSRKQDHVLCYRPGHGHICIFKHREGHFTKAFENKHGPNPEWKLDNDYWRLFAFDYDHSGKMDHICIYHRWVNHKFAILKRKGEQFHTVYKEMNGNVAGFQLQEEEDYVWALDYDKTGRQDHLLFMRFQSLNLGVRHHTPEVCIAKHTKPGHFTRIFHSETHFGTYNLNTSITRAFMYDFDSSGKMDHVGLWRPGYGIAWIMSLRGDHAQHVYRTGTPSGEWNHPEHSKHGHGIGGFPLNDEWDRCIAIDYNGSGCCDHILGYKLKTGMVCIVRRADLPEKAKAQEREPVAV